jgi:DNA end-binding protein Ku
MPRAVWNGSISFGLVTVPVQAFTATTKGQQVSFHQLERETGSRIRYRKVSEQTGEEVPAHDIVLGYEVDPGRLAVVDPDEVEALRPEKTKRIDISDFVDLEAIDPIYYEKTYWLSPANAEAARAYSLLAAAMVERGRVAIGKIVMNRREHLAAIRPVDGQLALSTMRFADEVVDRDAAGLAGGDAEQPDKKELALATQIIDALESEWDPEQYRDTYTEELRALVEQKVKGLEIVADTGDAPTEGGVVDLMAALEASVEAARRAS